MKKIIFDVDGVLLSEERYFDVSALVSWEILYSPAYLNFAAPQQFDFQNLSEEDIKDIRARIWDKDRLLSWLKERGINSNWDMVHALLVTTLFIMLSEKKKDELPDSGLSVKTLSDLKRLGEELKPYRVPSSEEILGIWNEFLADSMGIELFDDMENTFERELGIPLPWIDLSSPFYRIHQMAFQQWYLGDDLFPEIMGAEPYGARKEGFLKREQPLGNPEEIKNLFKALKHAGYKLGIATGRAEKEVEIPFRELGWYNEFDPDYIATASDASRTAKKYGISSLDKPNPFLVLSATYGRYPENYLTYIKGKRIDKNVRVTVIGDSRSDILGSEAAGASFIGVLTGLDGEESRKMFEREKKVYCKNVTEAMKTLLPGHNAD